MKIFIAALLTLISASAMADSKVKKAQEVNFEEMMMKGAIRNPDGSFLVQKKGLKFYPLYQVQKDLDQKIRDSEPEEFASHRRNQ
jgi:hypothetical protein